MNIANAILFGTVSRRCSSEGERRPLPGPVFCRRIWRYFRLIVCGFEQGREVERGAL
jgi:hypothetical protein